jgi:hypothetical protein
MLADALHLRAIGQPVTRFAMLHADVVPEGQWLDQLLDDLDASGADVVSAVVPMKDDSGRTSTAIGSPGDEWGITRWVGLEEAFGLPTPFSAADCGHPGGLLLVNSGCWCFRLDRPWCTAQREDGSLAVAFETRTRMLPIRRGGVTFWRGQAVTEDWQFSRAVAALGGKVLATSAVRLTHYDGETPYHNWKQETPCLTTT